MCYTVDLRYGSADEATKPVYGRLAGNVKSQVIGMKI